MGIDTIHDGLSRIEWRLKTVFQVEFSKKRAKGQFSAAF
jgi:hypothetical protein